MRWSYGITTVPDRVGTLLPRTIDSLRKAGFEGPRLFIDGQRNPQPYEDRFQLPVTIRHPPVGVVGNWILALWELYIRDSQAERFAIFQDDLVTYRNLRAYLEHCPYPDHGKQRGYWNLYTFKCNHKPLPSKNHIGWYKADQNGKGAVALIFSREAVITLLGHRHFSQKPSCIKRGKHSIDGGVVTTMRKAGWLEYTHMPSLVQHTGTVSSMEHKRKHPWKEDAPSFRGEDFDALDLIEESKRWSN